MASWQLLYTGKYSTAEVPKKGQALFLQRRGWKKLIMAVVTRVITEKQKESILSLRESHFGDLKSKDIAPNKLTRSISAFANADGGELYIGIDENKITRERYWRGFTTEEEANGHIQAFEQLFPLGQDFSYEFLECHSCPGIVLSVLIRKSREIILASDKIAYLRRGPQNLPQNRPEQIERLRYNKGIISFETQTLDVDSSLITNSLHIIRFMLEVIPTSEPEGWLKKQLLIRNHTPTVAGMLLFAEEPQALLPKRCGVKIYRYKTVASEGTRETLAFDPISIEGCIYEQIYATVRKTVEIIEGISILGPRGLENIKYPEEALHEIITNAVLHRDYSIQSDIKVRIFENRIEVESPGLLAGHITEKNILEEQFARNGALVRIINKFPNAPNKDVGEGLNTAFEAMRNLRLKDPEIKQFENSVVVYIRHELLAGNEATVLEYLESHEMINNKTGRELCHIGSENQMKRIFQKLMKAGSIERVPGLEGSAAAYRKKSPSKELQETVKQQSLLSDLLQN